MYHSGPKVKFFLFLVILTFSSVRAQSVSQYWQQQVSYNINVSLDDSKHMLEGVITITYVNNSPDSLSMLYMHLWPNAYKNISTAFAKQQLENGSVNFWFSDKEDRGYIDSLNFEVNGIKARWELDSANIDIAKIYLHRLLLPGQQMTITTPFRVKIPASFSRMGHVGQSYQITQWFPKPAVYDKDGWHPIPYLDQGEFFSEYGDFTVNITVPKNYRVAASGDLQTQSEINWLNKLAEETAAMNDKPTDLSTPPSDTATKTLTYTLKDAHDFAWFADKRYYVEKDSVQPPGSDRWVHTWTFYTWMDWKLWHHKSTGYVNNAIYYYSKWLGEYPYNNATAVEGALSAGGGMEYPTITIIGNTNTDRELETVIIHEVGHFWLYGILGSNERTYPWMDEGINSFYENRYFEEAHPDAKLLTSMPRMLAFFDLDEYPHNYLSQLMYLLTATQNKDQAINLPSEDFTEINYGVIVYGKSAVVFQHLRASLGDSIFDKAMHQYFTDWKFKHPSPAALRAELEKASGKDLGWFFDDLLNTTEPVDYAIKSVRKNKDKDNTYLVTIVNRSGLKTPFSLSGMNKGEVVTTRWYGGFEGEYTVEFPKADIDMIRIDAQENTADINRANNTWRKSGLFGKSEPIKFQLLASLDDPYKNQLFFFPFLGWNNYDKTMIGLMLSNNLFPFKRFEFDLVPIYGTATKAFDGIGRVSESWYPRHGKVQQVKVSVIGKRFSYLLTPDVAQWSKLEPRFQITLKRPTPRTPRQIIITGRSHNIWQQYFYRNEKRTQFFNINELQVEYNNTRRLNPFSVAGDIKQGEFVMNASITGNFTIHYMQGKERIDVRLFAGGFLWNNKSSSDIRPPLPVFQLSGSTGNPSSKTLMFQRDYTFDHFFLDRNGYDPILSHQVVTKDGGFRSMTIFGDNNRFMSTATVSVTAPKWIPLAAFGGLGVVTPTKNQWNLVAEMGIALVIIPDILEINMPFVTTNNIKQNQETGLGLDKFYERITFTLNLKGIDPIGMLRKRFN